MLGSSIRLVHGRSYAGSLPDAAIDPLRAQRVLSFLLAERLIGRRQVHRVNRPASLRLLRRVHTEAYLESLSSPEALIGIVGFEVSGEDHDRFLLSQREQVAGTALASRQALEGGGIVANLGGGLHHAERDRGQGFCAFNDVAVAIAARRAAGFDGRVLVVDLDLHDGDGTRRLFADDETVHTFSIHNHDLGAGQAVASTSVALGDAVDDGTYLRALRERLPGVVSALAPQLAFYLAGSDPALGDRLGNWRISAEALLERDRFVIDVLRGGAARAPVVILLAGGYGPDAWRFGARFLSGLCVGRRTVEPPPTASLRPERHRRLGRGRSRAERTQAADESWELTEADIHPGRPGPLFLACYTRHGIELLLERAGFMDRLRRLGLSAVRLELRSDDPREHTLVMRSEEYGDESVLELRARRDSRTVQGLTVLWLEWLLLQNPAARFTAERPRLPGQRLPGLGLLGEVSAVLVLICERLGLDGIAFVPSHYHIAARARSRFRFLDDLAQARFEKLGQALGDRTLAEAARALEEGRVRDRADASPVPWVPSPMVVAVNSRLRERLQDPGRLRNVADLAARIEYDVDPRP